MWHKIHVLNFLKINFLFLLSFSLLCPLPPSLQTLWIFGPFRGISMDVASIDPMVHSLPGKGQEKEKRAIPQKSSEETVLSLLAREQNTELISNKYVQALLDTKCGQ